MSKNLEILIKEMEKIHPHYTIAEVGKILELGRKLLAEEQAQKHTAPAGLVEELENLVMESPCTPTPQENTDFKNKAQRIISRYRPAPSSADEGLRKELEDIAYKGICRGIKDLSVRGVAREVLSRHPSTAKSADHFVEVNKLVKRLRERIGKKSYCDYEDETHTPVVPVYEITKILDEFSEDADGKEGR